MDLSEVSYDILFHILIHVPFWELNSNCRLVCKRWKDAVDSQSLWREKYKQALSKKLQTRLPSNTDWKNLFYKLFARNLIKNPCGDDGFEYWNVNHGGDGWVIERHHGELKETTSPNCFVTSYRIVQPRWSLHSVPHDIAQTDWFLSCTSYIHSRKVGKKRFISRHRAPLQVSSS
uniref:Uncharacterized protein n=1 Tax=Erpetoichthys calabaricus TaxID=27687 RepID=A0A8C4XFC6_ERPCA